MYISIKHMYIYIYIKRSNTYRIMSCFAMRALRKVEVCKKHTYVL